MRIIQVSRNPENVKVWIMEGEHIKLEFTLSFNEARALNALLTTFRQNLGVLVEQSVLPYASLTANVEELINESDRISNTITGNLGGNFSQKEMKDGHYL